ncbi:pyridoxal-phosphate-dependent aminotransferase family protein [Tepidibacter aestuarii]|uniref:pyridoxal-phosphate-dependent aminotransferase family protein n=1 Tax=Tepidibacter aestuarii TaxID=2925782 RepID=UPI0020C123AB|nr:alanine--glyoxylate aminotransferase family protein [Tepidibacter aestuarii]CAH2214058.1 Aspartate aminotransferase [Tepidibacter aestuarii]
MNKPLIMTPGPTYIHQKVRQALSEEITNPDLDQKFYEYYKETCDRFKELLKTKNDVLILDGEGILGLEAACASLIEPDDKVLCIDNGVFGNGFGEFAKMYGGEVTYFNSSYDRSIDVELLKKFLNENNDFKVATLVHCETPSGITNPVDIICPLLKEYGILTVVDSVSAIGGEEVRVDDWEIDIILGGSQKCLSAPPGLTFLSISDEAWTKILNRESPIRSYYANLAIWKDWYEKKWFPYTQPISDIYGLRTALDRVLDEENIILRHKNVSNITRKILMEKGFKLYPSQGYSNTVSTIILPEKTNFKEIYNKMLDEHNILIGGGIGFLKDKVVRIGHMGENCYEDKIRSTIEALNDVFEDLNISL